MAFNLDQIKALQFHMVTPRLQLCGTWNRPSQFESFLEFMVKQEVEIVLPCQGKSGVIIAFDDGEESIYHYAFPLLKKFSIKAIVFVVVGYIGCKSLWDISLSGRHSNHLSWDQILEMKEWGIDFGSHTLTHRDLTKLSTAELEQELSGSKAILEKKLGVIDSLSYPFNRVNARVLVKTREAGYRHGFGGDGSDVLLIKKEAVYVTDNTHSLSVKIYQQPRLTYKYERFKQKIINFFTLATMLKRPNSLDRREEVS